MKQSDEVLGVKIVGGLKEAPPPFLTREQEQALKCPLQSCALNADDAHFRL